jgi:nucleotide-binding universal stress UspA family protein
LGAAVSTAREVLDASGISFDVSADYFEQVWADDLIGERARYADLTLIGPDIASDPTLRKQVLNGCLFESGRPILLLPASGKRTLKPKTIFLAWNSGVEAARAVQQSLELMVAAEEVRVVLVDPRASIAVNGEEPGADIGTYLARHGVTVTVEQMPSAGRSVGAVLKQHAIDVSADLIVMGAYGHSRMRERLFGGVTKAMLDAPDVPVLMAH